MTLNPGARFGPYEILELAGSGGMGEVYKARDTRLDRTVAIKVLPAHASANPELKQRFEREAQAIANLKHPNICVLHDIGREDGTAFIVMEYLEGETLADRIARQRVRSGSSAASHSAAPKSETAISGRALKLDEALNIAIQIADALDQAHQHGVIHRDLKPANVMLVAAGSGSQSSGSHVKLLDFGLAKLTTAADPIASANTKQDLTGPGVVLGTVRYMSPEQIEGRPVDTRTDVFAFGALLYEMLTGRKAFDGKTQSSVIAAILNVDPMPVAELVPIAPRSLDRLVTRCLAKDPDDRWQSVHDLLIQLRWIAGRKGHASAGSGAAPAKRERWALAAIAASILIIAGMGVPAYRYIRGAAAPEEFRFRVPAVGLSAADFAISPDGATIAMVARPGAEAAAIWVRRVNEINYRRLDGTDGATQPFWSQDNSSIGFVAGGRIKKVAVSGSPPQEIGSLTGTFYGGTWSADGTILFGSSGGLRRISAEGGTAESVTTVELPDTGHFWPHFLPDGTRYVYTAWSAEADKRAIVAGTIGSSGSTRVVSVGSNAQYAQGYLVFRREATLMAQPFNADGLQASGAAVQITGDVGGSPANGRGYFDVSRTGNLVYFQGANAALGTGRAGITPNWQFGWHTRTGQLLGTAGDNAPHGDADVSPDGKLVAVTRQETGATGSDVWVMDTQRGVSTKLTLDPADDMNPVWAADGKRIAFVSFRKGTADIYVKNANGVGPETPLIDSPSDEYVEDWSKDGRHLIYKQVQGEFEDLYVLPFDADGKPGKPFPVVQGPYHKDEPQFSYDGKWLAYGSDESGRFEVYVMSFPQLDQKIKVSNEGGSRPRWRRDSREIYYMRLRSGVMAADFIPGPKIEAGIPHLLYTNNAGNADPTRHLFDVSPDGQRFFQRTAASIAGANAAGNGFPSVPLNFTTTAAEDAGAGQTPLLPPVNPSTNAANGLTVIRHWTPSVRKAVK
ncbi:MAG TPA: protein kinase [Vicinamibacterales bacterium]|nr:protein kinase [Vicinamibacterales bacterium]